MQVLESRQEKRTDKTLHSQDMTGRTHLPDRSDYRLQNHMHHFVFQLQTSNFSITCFIEPNHFPTQLQTCIMKFHRIKRCKKKTILQEAIPVSDPDGSSETPSIWAPLYLVHSELFVRNQIWKELGKWAPHWSHEDLTNMGGSVLPRLSNHRIKVKLTRKWITMIKKELLNKIKRHTSYAFGGIENQHFLSKINCQWGHIRKPLYKGLLFFMWELLNIFLCIITSEESKIWVIWRT